MYMTVAPSEPVLVSVNVVYLSEGLAMESVTELRTWPPSLCPGMELVGTTADSATHGSQGFRVVAGAPESTDDHWFQSFEEPLLLERPSVSHGHT